MQDSVKILESLALKKSIDIKTEINKDVPLFAIDDSSINRNVINAYLKDFPFEITEKENRLQYTPIVALSAFALENEREKSLGSGFDEHICKPVKKERILSTLYRHINRKSQKRSA